MLIHINVVDGPFYAPEKEGWPLVENQTMKYTADSSIGLLIGCPDANHR